MWRQLKQRIGVEPWQRTLFILFFVQMLTAVGYSSIFPFLPLYVENLGSAYGINIELLAGLVFSGQAASMMIASPIWGSLADRFGRKLMVQRAQFGAAILLTLMAFVTNAEQLVLLRTIQGFISGTLAANNALVASITPRKRSGYAMGLLQVGLGSGLAVGPLIGGLLADAFGYSEAFIGTGVLLLISGLLVTFGIKEEFDPEEAKEKNSESLPKEIKRIFKTTGIPATYAMRFMTQLGRVMIIPILPFLVATLTIGRISLNTYVGIVTGIASGTTTISAIYLGRLGDRIGHRKVLIGSFLFAGLLYLPQAKVSLGWQIMILQALAGVAMGGLIPSISALLANYTVPGEEGAVYGLDNSINAAGRAVAPMLGSLVVLWFSLRATFVASAITFFIGALGASLLLPKVEPKAAASEV